MKLHQLLLMTAACGLLVGVATSWRPAEAPQEGATEHLLRLCFPDHSYHADADPICPAFRRLVIKKLNQGEPNADRL